MQFILHKLLCFSIYNAPQVTDSNFNSIYSCIYKKLSITVIMFCTDLYTFVCDSCSEHEKLWVIRLLLLRRMFIIKGVQEKYFLLHHTFLIAIEMPTYNKEKK